jgi:hypothetical protein
MACSHGNEKPEECDKCIAKAEKNDQTAQGIQRAAESRRIRGGGRTDQPAEEE